MPQAYVGSMMPIGDDIEFWSRQIAEHCLFIQLGLDNKELKRRAEQLHQAWEGFRRSSREVRDAIGLVLSTRDLKTEIHTRLLRGEWLGWLWPLFIDHIRREGDYFFGALQGTKFDPVTECQIWLTFMAEHAAFAAHLLDPSEAARIRQALQAQEQLGGLFHDCGKGVSDQLLSLTQRSGMDLDAYLGALGVGKPDGAKSIIHPVLAEHVVREGRRFLQTMQALQQELRAAPAA